MFGNRLGWMISGVLVVATTLLLWALHRQGHLAVPPGPVGARAASFHLRMPALQPREVADFLAERGDAVELYRQAIELHEEARLEFARPGSRLSDRQRDAIEECMELLIHASRRDAPGVFADRPEEIINYDANKRSLSALKNLADMAQRRGAQYHRGGEDISADPARAMELYQARFALGLKLWEERLTYAQFEAGLNMMDVAHWMAELAESQKQPELAFRYRRFHAQRAEYTKEQVLPVYRTLWALYPHPGDAIAFATRGGEAMWRVEATLVLGRCKYSTDLLSDRNAVHRVIEELAAGGDEHVRMAARAAKALTVEEYRRYGG